jgi:hypothetical protein
LSTTPRSYKNNLIAKLVSIFANIEEKKGWELGSDVNNKA